MRTILTLIRKDLQLFLHDKPAVALTFIVPIVLIYIFGQVFGVSADSSGPTGIRIAVVNEADTAATRAITTALDAEKAFRVMRDETLDDGTVRPLTETRVRELIQDNTLRFAVIFPADSATDDTFGLKLKVLTNPRNEIETQTVNGLLQKVIFTSAPQAMLAGLRKRAEAFIGEERTDAFYRRMAQTVASSFDGDADEIYARMKADTFDFGPAASADANAGSTEANANNFGGFIDRIIKIDTEQLAGADVKSPAATRSVGGWAIMFLLFSLTGAATSLFDEKKAGLFQRLLASPVRRSHILWSKYLFCMTLGLVQLTVLFTAGRLMFGIDITTHFGKLVLVCLAASTACTAFGMLLASIAKTPAAAQGLATFLVLTMSAIGGAWFPTSFMPELIQTLSRFTIVYWSMEGFLRVLWQGADWIQLLPVLGVLLGTAAALNAISVYRFNRGNLFD